MEKILLISMPWQKITIPSLALGILKGILKRNGVECDCYYPNIKFAEMIGPALYSKVAESRLLEGERLFSPFVFSNHHDDRNILPEKRYWLYSLPPNVREGFLNQNEYESIHRIIPDFFDKCLHEIPWDAYDLVGFTTLFDQNLSSLAFAKRIKKLFPSKVIILGGANCDGEMGPNLHKKFKWIDYVVVGEAENNIVPLIFACRTGGYAKDIPGIVYRGESGETIFTGYNTPVPNMDSIPLPDYDDYFCTIESSTLNITPSLYFESSRGCWWGQKHHCTFCGLNQMGLNYRIKSSKRVLKEILKLSRKYKVLKLAATDTILPIQFIRDLFPSLARMRKRYHLDLGYEIKSNLTKEQIQTMVAAGVTSVQPGIESFSDHVLTLMNKGCTGIMQIQTLKWLTEFKIKIWYGILHSFPSEKTEDYVEMLQILSYITHLVPPEYCTPIQLHRFSPYFEHPDHYGIKNIKPFIAYRGIYPFSQEDLSKIAYFFDFETDNSDPELIEARNACIRQISEWRDKWKPDLLTYRKGPGFMIICDRRGQKEILRTFGQNESRLYSYCDAYRSYNQIVREFKQDMSEREISDILDSLVNDKLMYKDSSNRFISLGIQDK